MFNISQKIVRDTIIQRAANSHKGTYGKVCVIGGNEQYGGAIIMASQAAVYSGAGLVTTITSKSNHSSLHTLLPEAMVCDWENFDDHLDIIQGATVILIGPGLGLNDFSLSIFRKTIESIKPHQICIMDGSALTLLANHSIVLPKNLKIIFTPHEMEWQRLSGLDKTQQNVANNTLAAKALNGIVILKKHHTEVYMEKSLWKNTLGTPAMATGGMGDTLAGMIAGFTAQFDNTCHALLSAVYLHSFIGEKIGETNYVVLPSNLIKHIPLFMKQFEK